MKIFLDTGDINAIKQAQHTGLLDGVTTNPSHIAATGRPFLEVVNEICDICPGPISVEAVANDTAGLVGQGRELSKIAPNITIKIPMTVEGLRAVPILESEGIACNVTMIFSSSQAYLAMKSGATYISIVLSRLDAIGNESEILVQDAALVRDNYDFKSEIIAGSLKTQNHILACLRNGIDIGTIPPYLFMQLFKHNLTDSGLAQFEEDWAKVPR
jgi:transaldolase